MSKNLGNALTFEVVGREFKKKANKQPVFKVNLKTTEGDSLTLVSDSKDIYSGYPEGETFSVFIKKSQKTITDFNPQAEE